MEVMMKDDVLGSGWSEVTRGMSFMVERVSPSGGSMERARERRLLSGASGSSALTVSTLL